MNAILIDCKVLPKQCNLILKLGFTPPKSLRGFNPGLILLLENQAYDKLSNMKIGQPRLDYINSEEFLTSIETHYYIMFNDKKQICILDCHCERDLPKVLTTLFTNLPPETLIWTAIPLEEKDFTNKIDTFVSNGFNSPYVTTLSPLYADIPVSAILTRQNIPSDPDISTATLHKVLYAIEQYKSSEDSCHLLAKLTKKALYFLRQAAETGLNVNEPQKELTGELYVKDVQKGDDGFIYIIDLDKSSISSGEEEKVDVAPTRYNFHSHPRDAYIRHSVDKAWPSVTDYLGYYKLGTNTIFHCVAALEGVYILSFNPHWAQRLKEIKPSFIKDNFDIDHKEHYTPQQYVEKINNIKYQGNPIYNLQFYPWNTAEETVFKVFFPTTGSSCLPSQKIVEKYKKVHNG